MPLMDVENHHSHMCGTKISWTQISCSGHVDAAIKSYKQALLLRPDFPEATCNLLHTLQVLSELNVSGEEIWQKFLVFLVWT